MQIECAQRDLSQVIILDEDRKAAREGQGTNNIEVGNLQPVTCCTPTTSIPDLPMTGMEPVCTAADLPPEVRRNVLLTIREEDEEDYDSEDKYCGSCGDGNDCCQTENDPGDDDDGLDDYPFDY